jgi:hypothetical protein
MRQPKPELALRYRGGDRHHLFLNHGTWFLRYSVREAPWLKARRRIVASLGTKDIAIAKERRDAAIEHLQFHFANGGPLDPLPVLSWPDRKAA